MEAGAGAGEGAKRKRSDDMAALEADLEPEPQAGESCCTKMRQYLAGLQLMSWSVEGTCMVCYHCMLVHLTMDL